MKKHDRQKIEAINALFSLLSDADTDADTDKLSSRSDESEMTSDDYIRSKNGEHQDSDDCHDAYESSFADGVDCVVNDMTRYNTTHTLRDKILYEIWKNVGNVHPSETKLLAESLLILSQSDAINDYSPSVPTGSDCDDTDEQS